jgi:hypothetical protein
MQPGIVLAAADALGDEPSGPGRNRARDQRHRPAPPRRRCQTDRALVASSGEPDPWRRPKSKAGTRSVRPIGRLVSTRACQRHR